MRVITQKYDIPYDDTILYVSTQSDDETDLDKPIFELRALYQNYKLVLKTSSNKRKLLDELIKIQVAYEHGDKSVYI